MTGEPDIAAVAAAMGAPARGSMLLALLGGRALSAGDLSKAARVSASTASSHLAVLVEAGLVEVEPRGRHRLHRLASDGVAHAVEALAAIAPRGRVRSLGEGSRIAAERAGRSCHDHLAGALGVAVTDRLCVVGALDPRDLSLRDEGPFRALGIEVGGLATARRPLTRSCLDWSERRPHLAGALGAALLDAMLSGGWLVRRPGSRALRPTEAGRDALREHLGVALDEGAVALRRGTPRSPALARGPRRASR